MRSPACAAILAASSGGMAPALLLPSVSRISTVSPLWPALAGSAFSRLMARPMASPIAVCVPATPIMASSRNWSTVLRSGVSGGLQIGSGTEQDEADLVTVTAADEIAGHFLHHLQASCAARHVLVRHGPRHVDRQQQAPPGGG